MTVAPAVGPDGVDTGRPITHHAVRVPATTANLGPGFDSFGAALTRYLYARTVDRADADRRVVTGGLGSGDVPTGDDNLVWRAFAALCEHVGVPVPEVALRVHNDVPLQRGLGSSSAAIVAGLSLARVAVGARLGDPDVAVLATAIEGHPDNVVPALLGGLTVTTTTDDGAGLAIRVVAPHARLRPLVLVPGTRQSTVAARAAVPATVPAADVAVQAGRAGHVLAGLAGLWPVAPGAAGDRLHEPVRLAAMAGSGAVVGDLRTAGVHAWLSGAGPSVAAAVPAARPDLTAACRRIGERHGFEVAPLDWDGAGARVCPVARGCGWTVGRRCVRCPADAV